MLYVCTLCGETRDGAPAFQADHNRRGFIVRICHPCYERMIENEADTLLDEEGNPDLELAAVEGGLNRAEAEILGQVLTECLCPVDLDGDDAGENDNVSGDTGASAPLGG